MNQFLSKDKPTNASGRFGRLSYLAWLFLSSVIFMIIIGVLVAIFGLFIDPQHPESISTPAIILVVILYIAFIYFSIIFMIRRLHDRNHSGWLALLMLVPLVNVIFAIYLLFAKGDAETNNYGAPRVTQSWEKVVGWIYILMIPVVMILAVVWMPSYQSYIERAQQAQIQQSYGESPVQE